MRQRGAASIEVVLLIPVVMMLVCVCVAGWRIGWARAHVTDAASSAARAASMQTSGHAAREAADIAARSDLETTHIVCRSLVITADTRGFALRPGTRAEVSVDVTCVVDLSDVLVAGLPGQMTITGHGSEVLDSLRRRHR